MKKQAESHDGSKKIADSLSEFVGEDVAAVIRELYGKPDYSEFKLAEALGRELNATRNLLYKLHSLNLASFTKKKDNKIGWYIYYWTFHEDRVDLFLLNEKKRQINALTERVAVEGDDDFYACANKCAKLDFDNAFELSFRCPECGELLGQESNKARSISSAVEITRLRKEIQELELCIEAEKVKNIENNSIIMSEKDKPHKSDKE